ncbi:hypothetical protein [Radiobacillus deserti]|uniref:Uncharacterized protein n=1 Tax=Radiobacillus deserti TaxID=2594883 RepID=A0A516KDR7_9BACI|nr:hypothetical protein [Radiobacillus deserti]QDP39541.1 hypothetical protein FN924_04725 [Radiobacillus deserti]
MNNRSVMTTIFTIGVASAAVYSIGRIAKNGSMQKVQNTISNTLMNQNKVTDVLQKSTNTFQQVDQDK